MEKEKEETGTIMCLPDIGWFIQPDGEEYGTVIFPETSERCPRGFSMLDRVAFTREPDGITAKTYRHLEE